MWKLLNFNFNNVFFNKMNRTNITDNTIPKELEEDVEIFEKELTTLFEQKMSSISYQRILSNGDCYLFVILCDTKDESYEKLCFYKTTISYNEYYANGYIIKQ